MSPKTAASFMRFMAIISIFSGIILAIGVVRDVAGISEFFFATLSSGNEGLAGIDTLEAKVALAVAGGVFAGFGAMLLFIAVPAIEEGDARIKRGILFGVLTWFVVDSSASIAGGNPMNAVGNSVFLALYLLPLLWVKKQELSEANR